MTLKVAFISLLILLGVQGRGNVEILVRIFVDDFKNLPEDFVKAIKKATSLESVIILSATVSLTALSFAVDDSIKRWSEQTSNDLKKAAEIFDFFGDGLLLTTSTFFAYSVAVISSDSRSKRMTISALESMGLASIITQTAKFTAGRRRPHLAKSPSDFKSFGGFEGNYRRSFFSGHTSASFALATSLSYEVTGAKKIPFFILPLFIGISRVVSQQHWASDIVAGSGIGIWAGYLLY